MKRYQKLEKDLVRLTHLRHQVRQFQAHYLQLAFIE